MPDAGLDLVGQSAASLIAEAEVVDDDVRGQGGQGGQAGGDGPGVQAVAVMDVVLGQQVRADVPSCL